MIKVTVWNEGRHEKSNEKVRAIYPEGIHGAVKAFLEKNEDMIVRAVTLDDPDNGLPDELLNDTDVLMWWGHMAHGAVPDELAEKAMTIPYEIMLGFSSRVRREYEG